MFFFFFQAEDGIRDKLVTGVQTCALPILLMGDLVLLESEVGPVLGKLQDGGIEQTALHNHVLHESPRVMYMHIGGRGPPAGPPGGRPPAPRLPPPPPPPPLPPPPCPAVRVATPPR